MSSAPCWGQFTKFGESSPLETRESKTGCTTPVDPARWPSDGPSDPASESPPIQSRKGSTGSRGARHVCAAAVPAPALVELGAVEVGGQAALAQELGVTAMLDDAALVHHEDPIRVHDRRQPVCDHQRGAAAQRLGESTLDRELRLGVEM